MSAHPETHEEARVQLVEAVLNISEAPTIPPSHLDGLVIRSGDRWQLDPDAAAADSDGALGIWQRFVEWRNTWEKRWRLGDLGELWDMTRCEMPNIEEVLCDIPVTLGAASLVTVCSAAADMRDKLEQGTIFGWKIVGNNGSFVRGHNRQIVTLNAGCVEIRPNGVFLGDKPVRAWQLLDDGTVTLDGQAISKSDSSTFAGLFPGAVEGKTERVSLSAPWAAVGAQIVHACSQAVIHELPLSILAAPKNYGGRGGE